MKILNTLPKLDKQDIADYNLLGQWIRNSRTIRESPGLSQAFEDLLQRRMKDKNNLYNGNLYRCTYFGADKAESLFDKGTSTLNKYPAYSFAHEPDVAYDFYDTSKANHTRAVVETKGTGLDLYKCLGNILENITQQIHAANNAEIIAQIEADKKREMRSMYKAELEPVEEQKIAFRSFLRWLSDQPYDTPAKKMFNDMPPHIKSEFHWHLNEAEIVVPRGLQIKSADIKEIDPDDELLAKARSNEKLATALLNYKDAAKKIEKVQRKQEEKKKESHKEGKKDKHKDKKHKDKDKKEPKVLDYGIDGKDGKDEKSKKSKPGKWFFEMTKKQRKKYIEKHPDSGYDKWVDKDLPK